MPKKDSDNEIVVIDNRKVGKSNSRLELHSQYLSKENDLLKEERRIQEMLIHELETQLQMLESVSLTHQNIPKKQPIREGTVKVITSGENRNHESNNIPLK